MIQLKYLKVRIKICVEKDDDRYYAYCPELKGVHEDGDSVEDATQNAKESALVYIQSILEHNESLAPAKSNLTQAAKPDIPPAVAPGR